MSDWKISNSSDNDWVYYVCTTVAAFANLHFSRSVGDPSRDHIATNDRVYYYYGLTGTFNAAAMQAAPAVRQALVDAWTDYFTVR